MKENAEQELPIVVSDSEDRKTVTSGSSALQLTTSYDLPVTIIKQNVRKETFIILKGLYERQRH